MRSFLLRVLANLRSKPQEQGFTLIELLVVIVIIGVLAGIALPSYLQQGNKARLAEANTHVSAVNRSQQAYYLENNDFASSNSELRIGLPTQTADYTFSIQTTDVEAISIARPNAPTTTGVGGRVFIPSGESSTSSVLCQGTPGQAPDMTGVTNESECP